MSFFTIHTTDEPSIEEDSSRE